MQSIREKTLVYIQQTRARALESNAPSHEPMSPTNTQDMLSDYTLYGGLGYWIHSLTVACGKYMGSHLP